MISIPSSKPSNPPESEKPALPARAADPLPDCSGTIQLDATTLFPLERKIALPPYFPGTLNRMESDFPGMEIRRISRLEDPGPDGHAYHLQWESLGPNRDQKPPAPLPEPSMLRVHKLKALLPSPEQSR